MTAPANLVSAFDPRQTVTIPVQRLWRVELFAASDVNRAKKYVPCPMRVLLVDDNPDALSILSLMFAAEGHIVTMATNPTEALGHAAATRPEVVLLDIGMPGMNGFDLARAIRALDQKPRPLIVALSGYVETEHIRRGFEAGFDFHYPKTIEPNVVLETVREHAARVARMGIDNRWGKPH